MLAFALFALSCLSKINLLFLVNLFSKMSLLAENVGKIISTHVHGPNAARAVN